jgi:AcrR family transcriptional regulator
VTSIDLSRGGGVLVQSRSLATDPRFVNIDISLVRYFLLMVRPAQTARSERTREALRRAAVVRFIAQGVEETSAEEIAADAGVSLRTFYRHFASKHDLLFADYDAGLHWFRDALASRSPDESIIESVQFAVMARPCDDCAVMQVASLRARELDPSRIVRHIRQVEGDFAEAIEQHLMRDDSPRPGTDERMRITVTARCIAAAIFGAMEVWMLAEDRSLPELSRLCAAALETLRKGIGDHA